MTELFRFPQPYAWLSIVALLLALLVAEAWWASQKGAVACSLR